MTRLFAQGTSRERLRLVRFAGVAAVVATLLASVLASVLAAAAHAAEPTARPDSEMPVGQGEAQVYADLERFVRTRVGSEEAEITIPPLASFAIDAQREGAPLRTRLSTRAEPPFSGQVAITVELYAGDALVRRGIVSVEVRVKETVVVPTRDLRRGDVLATRDLKRVRRDRSRLPSDAIRELSEAVGLRARRSVRSGRILRTSQVEGVPVVDRGDRVTLVLDSGVIQIRGIGRAVEAGAVGDWIRVVNLDSKRELSGRVDREGNVHVAY